jgi:predicted enzyme related to lactoylglutathione lyase
MGETPDYTAGTPSWVDLSTTDVDAAGTFYNAIFGWVTEPVPDLDAGGYTMISSNGRTIAAMAPLQGLGRPPSWMTYVTVDDADKTVELAQSAGGTVVMAPLDVFDAGRMAVVADLSGAAIALWQPGEHKGAAVQGEPNTYCWTELNTRDTASSVEFYGAVFGWGAHTSDVEGMSYTEFKNGDRSIAGMMPMPAEMPAEVPSYWMPYFEVTDPDKAAAETTALGGSVMLEPTTMQPGRFAILRDPQGAAFGVIRSNEATG